MFTVKLIEIRCRELSGMISAGTDTGYCSPDFVERPRSRNCFYTAKYGCDEEQIVGLW
jgi:hypothetical protein